MCMLQWMAVDITIIINNMNMNIAHLGRPSTGQVPRNQNSSAPRGDWQLKRIIT